MESGSFILKGSHPGLSDVQNMSRGPTLVEESLTKSFGITEFPEV